MFEHPLQVAHTLANKLGGVSVNLPHLAEFVEVLFSASLLREEGHTVRFGAVYPGIFDEVHLTPERTNGHTPWHVMDFQPHIDFDATSAAKLGSLAAGEGEYLVVHSVGYRFVISGVGYVREIPWFSRDEKYLTALVLAPGVIRFFHGNDEILAYARGSASPPPRWPFASKQPALEDVITCIQRMTELAPPRESTSVALSRLCAELIQRKHGGMIAILSETDQHWAGNLEMKRVKTPLEFGSRFIEHWEASMVVGSKEDPPPDEELEYERSKYEEERALSLIGRMSTVDGAVILTPELFVVGFGAKLPIGATVPHVKRVAPDETLVDLDMTQRGTRHRSAANFVADGNRRIALIASVDGDAAVMFRGNGGELLYWPVRERYSAFGL